MYIIFANKKFTTSKINESVWLPLYSFSGNAASQKVTRNVNQHK